MNPPKMLLVFAVLAILAMSARADDSSQLFEQLDQNQDGWLLADEIASEHQRLFQRLLRTSDGDQDGKLSVAEFEGGLRPGVPKKPLVEKQESRMPGADALLLLLAKMDANADRRIEATEVPAQFRDVFSRIEDRLGGEPDGVLDQREITQAAPKLSHLALRVTERMDIDVELELALLPKKQWEALQNMDGGRRRGEFLSNPRQARELFARLDANDDGQVTESEVPDQFATRFERLLERADRNRDDQLSERELLSVSQQLQRLEAMRLSPIEIQKGAKGLLKRFDKNNDKQLSRKEVPRRLANRFDRFDADGDGRLKGKELSPLVEILSRLRASERGRVRMNEPMMVPGN